MCGRGRDGRGTALDPGVVLPPAPSALARRGAPPADRLHAQVDAQAQGGRLAARATSPATRRSARSSATRRPTPPRWRPAALLGPGHLGPDGRARQARARRHRRHRSHRGALPATRSTRSGPRSRSTRTSRRSAGCRTSRATWARGRTTSSTCGPALDVTVEPVTRPASASPSVGTIKRHTEEQKALLDAAFAAAERGSGSGLLRLARVLHRSRHRGARQAPG